MSDYLAYEPLVLGRFDEFNASLFQGRLPSVATAPLDSKLDALQTFWDVATSLVTKFKEGIRNHNGYGCPYCGDFVPTNEIDHYLPKTSYGEFTMFLPNLVPSCSTCNKKLGTFVDLDAPGLYPYADPFLDERLLRVNIRWKEADPFFRLLVREDMPAKQRCRVVAHFDRVGLASRFVYFASTNIPRYRNWAGQSSYSDLVIRLLGEGTDYRNVTGPNSWHAPLTDAIAQDEAMVNWLIATAGREKPKRSIF